jgi:aspartate carbamoyltransferase regulatory subunit
MSETRNFVVKKLPIDKTSTVSRVLKKLAGAHALKIAAEMEDEIEFTANDPRYAFFEISVIAPSAVIKERKDGIESDVSEDLPIWIEGLLGCSNRNCITAQPKEPTKAKFKVITARPPKVQCFYCGRYVDSAYLISKLI